MGLVQVIDVGTTNVKSGIVDRKGKVVARASRSVNLERPEPGAAEHDPEKLFKVFCDIARQTNEGFRSEIDYLVLTGYLFGFLPLDKEKEPLTGMVTLLDERPKSVMGILKRRFSLEELYRRTGCPPLFIYSFAKILWLEEQKPEIHRRSRYFADLKSFLLEKLTGEFVTESSTASATQLYNVGDGDWDDEILGWLELDRSSLPGIRQGNERIGPLVGESAELLGVSEGTALLSGLYDGGAMILGMGGSGGVDAICNLGTTAMLRKCSPRPVLDRLEERRLQTYSLLPGRWAIGGSLNNAGVALKWFRDNFAPDRSYNELVRAAGEVEPGSQGLLFLPFLTGERDPRMGNFSSGVFFGLKERHKREHLTRAVMEGVAYGLGLILKTMEERDMDVNKIIIGGSGSKGPLWSQIIADVLEVPVQKSLTEDATLIGGAMLAYRVSGTYSDLEEASRKMVEGGEAFTPRERYYRRYREGQRFFEKVLQKIGPLFEKHSRLNLDEEVGER